MATRKKYEVKEVKLPKGATLKQIYKILKARFTAADLAEYTKLDYDKMIPMEKVIAQMEAIHKRETAKLQREKEKKKRKK